MSASTRRKVEVVSTIASRHSRSSAVSSARAARRLKFARAVSQHDRGAREAGKTRQPTQRPARARERRVQTVARRGPKRCADYDEQHQETADVPEARGHVLFMYVAPDGLR